MRVVGFAVSVCVAIACACSGAASAQSLYKGGHWFDELARPYDLQALNGRYAIVTFAYGACRKVCSTSLQLMQQLQQRAQERHLALNFVVFGIDPEHDKPADWAQLRRDRHIDAPNWAFLSGDAASIARVARGLGVRYWRYGEHTMHDFRIVLLSPSGTIVRSIDAFDEDLEALLP